MLLIISGCKAPERIRRAEIADKTPEFLIREQQKTEPAFSWLSARVNAHAVGKDKNTTLRVSLRMKYDSLIWLSISPALGIEVARVIITRDSVFVMNRVNKTITETDFDYLSALVNTDIDFGTLQALLLGTALDEFNPSEFSVFPDREGYLISRLKRRKMKRVQHLFERIEKLERKEKQQKIEKLEDKKIDRITSQPAAVDSSNFVAQSVWLRPEDYRIIRYRFRDFNPDRLLDVNYSDFQSEGEVIIPHGVKIHTTGEEPMQLSLVYSRITIDEPLTFPFSIPDSYSRVTLD